MSNIIVNRRKHRHTYLVPSRPPAPGAVPRSGLLEINCFDERKPIAYVIGCGYFCRECWGWVVYDRRLKPEEIDDYELIEPEFVYEKGIPTYEGVKF